MELTNKQKQYLKSEAHALKPVVMLGQHGLTEGVMAEIEVALNHHELIKIKIPPCDKADKKALAETICQHTKAVCPQQVGRILVLFRPVAESQYQLPKR